MLLPNKGGGKDILTKVAKYDGLIEEGENCTSQSTERNFAEYCVNKFDEDPLEKFYELTSVWIYALTEYLKKKSADPVHVTYRVVATVVGGGRP